MTLSVVVITHNEEANIGRTLASVQTLVRELDGEIVVVDSGSTDRTRDIAESFGTKVFVEPWKGFAAQKNSAIGKATGDWILLLDADEEVSAPLLVQLKSLFGVTPDPSTGRPKLLTVVDGFWIPRQNEFLGRWIKHGGYWPDHKLRLFRRGKGQVEDRAVHETVEVEGETRGAILSGALIHHAYPTLEIYQEHMRRYAALGAEMIRSKPRFLLWLNRWLNPPLTFIYNYFFRLGFLDGREGLLLHYHHSIYISWKYAKALELSRSQRQ